MRRLAGSIWVAALIAATGAWALEVPVLESVNPAAGAPDAEVALSIAGQNLVPGMRAALLPGGPVMAGRADLLVDCYDVARMGDLALVAFFEHVDKFGGFRVLDVANPRAPQVIGSFGTVDMGQALAVHGSTAFIATLNPYTYVVALRSVDMSDPTNPRQLGVLYHPTGYPQSMTIDGSMAFIAAGTEGVLIVDISDPAAPLLRGQIPTRGFSYGVTVRDGIAYVADGSAGLQLFDVSVPESPRPYGDGAATAGLAYDVVVTGNIALVSDPIGGLFAFDLADPNSPRQLSQITTPGSPSGVWLEGARLFVADGPAGLTIVDVSNPAAPRVIGNAVPSSGAQTTAVQVDSGYAYLSDFFQGLAVFDVRRPAAPNTLAASLPLPGEARDAVMAAGRLYVAAGEAGLLVFDASNPRAVIALGALDTEGSAEAVVVVGTRAFVADGLSGLLVVDIANPAAPAALGSFDTTGNALALAVQGDLVYVADDARGMRVIDASNPTAPTQLGFYDTPGRSFGIAVEGSVAYVADYLRGVQLVDIENPRRPTLLSNLDTLGRSVGLALSGSELFVADDFNGVVILDVADSRAPRVLGQVALPGNALGVRLDGNTLSVAAGVSGLSLIDVTDRMHPFLFGAYDTPGSVRAIAGEEPDVLLADGSSGIATVHLNPRLGPVSFASSTRVSTLAPAGFSTGPYHVTLASNDGVATLENGYTVCEPRHVSVALTPVLSDGPDRMRVPLPWRVSLLTLQPQRAPYRGLRALLPALPTSIQTQINTGKGASVIEIVMRQNQATVRLTGADPAALEAMWTRLREAGGIDLPALAEDRSKAEVLIGFVPAAAPIPVVRGKRADPWDGAQTYRYTYLDGQLRVIEAGGDEADVLFEGYVDDDQGCAGRGQASLRAALAEGCPEWTKNHPALAAYCAGLPEPPAVAPPRKARAQKPKVSSSAAH